MDEECSDAIGVAGAGGVGVANGTGLDGALAALAGGSRSGGTLAVLLRQPIGQWRMLAHQEVGRTLRKFDDGCHVSQACEHLV